MSHRGCSYPVESFACTGLSGNGKLGWRVNGNSSCQTKKGFDVDRAFDCCRGSPEKGLEIRVLGRLNEPEMPVGQSQRRVSVDAPEYGNADPLGRLDKQISVPVAPDPVVDDACDVDVIAEARKPVDDSRCGGSHRTRVDYQDHRQPGGHRDIGGGALMRGRAIEEPHDTLDDDELRTLRRRRDNRGERRVQHRPRVEVQARPAARGGVKGRIDVVRPDLE